jgi:predicted PurR-regulated permease PerM
MRTVLWYILVIAITLMALILLWQLRIALVLFALSLAVSGALRPSVRYLILRRIPRPVAVGIVYGLTIATILFVFWLVGGPLMQEVQQASDDLVTSYDRAKAAWPQSGSLFQRALAEQLPPSADLYNALTGPQGMAALKGVLGVAQDFFTFLGYLAIIMVLSLYWSVDQQRSERLGISLLPADLHTKALGTWRSIESGVGDYVRSEMIQSLLAGVFLWIGYSLMGIQFPMLLALWAAVVRLIPWFGALVAVLPALTIVIWGSPALGLLAVIYTIIVVMGLKMFIEPRFFHRQPYSALIIVLFVISLAELFGFIGVILAPPLAVAAQILFFELYPLPGRRFSEETLQRAIEIRERLREVRGRAKAPVDERNVVLVNRLRRLLSRAIDYIQEY